MKIIDKNNNGILKIRSEYHLPKWELESSYSKDFIEGKIKNNLYQELSNQIRVNVSNDVAKTDVGDCFRYNISTNIIDNDRLNQLIAKEKELELYRKHSNEAIKLLVRNEQYEFIDGKIL